jgi:hypothetical protein
MMKYVIVAVTAVVLALAAHSDNRPAQAGPCNPQQQQC